MIDDSISKLLEEIRIENEWRNQDFAKIKIIYSNLKEDLGSVLLKISIPYVYAHWEGYVVDTLKKVLVYLDNLDLKHEEVEIRIFVLSIEESFDFLKGKQSFLQKCQFTKDFSSAIRESLKFSKKRINTKANLNFNVFKEICEKFGFDHEKFSEYKADLDKLVNIRNSIAHGENSYVFSDLEEIDKYMRLVIELTDILKIEIEDYLKEERYLLKL